MRNRQNQDRGRNNFAESAIFSLKPRGIHSRLSLNVFNDPSFRGRTFGLQVVSELIENRDDLFGETPQLFRGRTVQKYDPTLSSYRYTQKGIKMST